MMGNFIKILIISLSLLFVLSPVKINAQNIFYQDLFYGGVTGAGYSPGLSTNSGYFSVYIEPNSMVRKAFLICQRYQNPPPCDITLNNVSSM
jgi:hypothetical protein